MSDADLGKIDRGHVCKHGIRWPHPCDECDTAAWALRVKLTELLKDAIWLTAESSLNYVNDGYSPDSLLLDGNYDIAAIVDNLMAKGVVIYDCRHVS